MLNQRWLILRYGWFFYVEKLLKHMSKINPKLQRSTFIPKCWMLNQHWRRFGYGWLFDVEEMSKHTSKVNQKRWGSMLIPRFCLTYCTQSSFISQWCYCVENVPILSENLPGYCHSVYKVSSCIGRAALWIVSWWHHRLNSWLTCTLLWEKSVHVGKSR